MSQATISGDLANCTEGTNQTRSKTETNSKGAGRPKGSKKPQRETPTLDKARDIVRPFVEADDVVSSRKLQHLRGLALAHAAFARSIGMCSVWVIPPIWNARHLIAHGGYNVMFRPDLSADLAIARLRGLASRPVRVSTCRRGR